LEGSSADNRIVLLSVSSSWMDILALGMTRSGWDSAKACFNYYSSIDAVSLSMTSNYMVSVRKFSQVPKVTGRAIWPMGVAAAPGTMLWKGARLGHSKDLDNPIWSKVLRNRMFRELPPSMRTRLSLASWTMGQTVRGYRSIFGTKFRWSLRSKVMGTLDHLRYSGVAGETALTAPVVSFCFCLDS
jgi:hypothetical protein